MVFDVTSKESFSNVKSWLQEIDRFGSSDVQRLLVGNKTDLDGQRCITQEEAQQLADSTGIPYIETSAKNSTNIEQVFKTIATKIMQNVDQGARKLIKEPVQFDLAEPTKKGGCC